MNIDGFWLVLHFRFWKVKKTTCSVAADRTLLEKPSKGKDRKFAPKKWEGADCRSMVFHDFPFGCQRNRSKVKATAFDKINQRKGNSICFADFHVCFGRFPKDLKVRLRTFWTSFLLIAVRQEVWVWKLMS